MKNKTLKLIKLFSFALKTAFYTLICLLFLNCEEQPLLEFDEKTFYREWAAWEALGITDYSVKVKWEWNRLRPESVFYRITVKDYTLIKPVELLDGFENDLRHAVVEPISGTYDWIKALYESRKNVHGSIKITYNTGFHYPEIIAIDLPRREHPRRFGSGTIYFSEFAPLTPATVE